MKNYYYYFFSPGSFRTGWSFFYHSTRNFIDLSSSSSSWTKWGQLVFGGHILPDTFFANVFKWVQSLHLSFNWKTVIRCLMFCDSWSLFIQYGLLFSWGFHLPCFLHMAESIMSCWPEKKEVGRQSPLNRCLPTEVNEQIKSIRKLWCIVCIILVSSSLDTHPRLASVLGKTSCYVTCPVGMGI